NRAHRLGGERSARLRRFGLEDWCNGSDLHRLRDLADLQLHVDAGDLVDLERERPEHALLEAPLFGFYFVLADRKEWNVENARFIRDGRKRDVGSDVRVYDPGVSDDRTAW